MQRSHSLSRLFSRGPVTYFHVFVRFAQTVFDAGPTFHLEKVFRAFSLKCMKKRDDAANMYEHKHC